MSRIHPVKYRILAVALAVLLVLALLPSGVFAAGGTTTKYIAFTSDVHGEITRLGTWLNKLGSPLPVLDCVMFSGDYPVRGMGDNTAHEAARQCVSTVQSVFGPIPCYLGRGNHDIGGTYAGGDYHEGLVYNGDDYAVYVVKMDESNTYNQAFMASEIIRLDEALGTVHPAKPVFLISHFPIHYYSSRTTANADDMIDVLNKYSNAVFLWGHNHTMNDPYYGQIITAGEQLQYTSSSSDKATINFTYLSCGSMYDGNNGAYGLLAALTASETGTQIDFAYKNMEGQTASSGSVFISSVSGPIPIASVSITGIDMPIAGANPDDSALTAAASYTASAVQWNPADSPFENNTVYTASVTLTANSGYAFTPGVTAAVNGNNAAKTLNSDGTVTVTYTFPATGIAGITTYEKVNTVNSGEKYVIVAKSGGDYYALTNAAVTVGSNDYLKGAPVTVSSGGELSGTINGSMIFTFTTDGSGFDVTNDDKYLNRKSGYSGPVFLGPEDGASYSDWIYDDYITADDYMLYVYSSNQRANLYLNTASEGSLHYFLYSEDGQTVYLYRVIEGGVPSDTPIDSAAISIDAPEAGYAPDTAAAVSPDAFYTVSQVLWTPADSVFAENTVYEVAIKLKANSGYAFAPDIKAMVNGNAAGAIINADKTVTVSYVFPATGKAVAATYEKVDDIEPGTQYLIVAQSRDRYYALSNLPSEYDSGFLKAVEITVSDAGDQAFTIGGNSALLWNFDSADDANAYNITNDGKYLRRRSSQDTPKPPTGAIYTHEEYRSEAYSDWLMNAAGALYIVDNSNKSQYLYLASSSGGANYFKLSSDTGMTLSLYKQVFVTVPDIEINHADVTVTQPETGDTPGTAAVSPDAFYTVSQVLWTPADSPFEGNTVYEMVVVLTAKSGYAFTPDTTAAVNANAATAVYNSDGTLKITYIFEKTNEEPDAPINSVSIYVIPPKTGDIPNLNAVSDSNTATVEGVTWSPDASSGFAAGTVYTVTVTLSAKDGYKFAGEDLTATCNGMAAQTERSGYILTVTYDFPATLTEQAKKTVYVRAGDISNGGQYLIVAKFGNAYYALSPVHAAINGTVSLLGMPVTASEDNIMENGISDAMLWTFTTDDSGASFTITNNGLYLMRTAALSGIYVGADQDAEPYSVWMYDSTEKALFTYSVNRACNIYMNLFFDLCNAAFCHSPNAYTDIYLYKPIEATGPTEPPMPVVPVLVEAVFSQNDTVIYPDTAPDSLRQMLTVMLTLSDGTKGSVGSYAYSLSGVLIPGICTLTVEYLGLRDTFDVVVTALPSDDTEQNIEDDDVPRGIMNYLDVKEDAWYYDAVKFTTERGLFYGIDFQTFAPDLPVSRAMFATLLSRIEYESDDKIPMFECLFTDLTQNWYRKAVSWGAHSKIILGFTETLFYPDNNLSREQMAVLLFRYAMAKGYDMSFDPEILSAFDDADSIAAYAKTPVMWALDNGLLTGALDTQLAPRGHISRARLAETVMAFFEFIGKA
ncbi:MAG: hypothetical protein GX111_03105 [Clostridiales bacterium]|nr:hypothetical protein [Clostridiales bacterium]